jgi:small subunit ribosomal protein S25e
MKLITTSLLVERLKVNGALARASIKLLMAKGLIRQVLHSSSQLIYTRATNTGD